MNRFISVLMESHLGSGYAVVDTTDRRVVAVCERHNDADMVADALLAAPSAVEAAKSRAEEVPF